MKITTNALQIVSGNGAGVLWRYAFADGSGAVDFGAPVLSVDGRDLALEVRDLKPLARPKTFGQICTEHRHGGVVAGREDLSLEVVFRVADESPVVRFRYVLTASAECRLTKPEGRDALSYLSCTFAEFPRACEVQLGNFNERVHSYCPEEREIEARQFEHGLGVMGPILLGEAGGRTLLLAYEHGSTVPDAFIHFVLGGGRRVEIRAVKGNYWNGQELLPGRPFETPWFHAAMVAGDKEAMARNYRRFVLHHQTLNKESRKPYIFYNTWAFQERNKWRSGKTYLDSMTQERMLAEIDVAARMGVDVFVLDTGWYGNTGDWRVNLKRFPDGLKAVRERLERNRMKLGLWFSPTLAAVSSKMMKDHRDCLMSWKGKEGDPCPVWETEESQGLCLVSRYADAYADELIRLVKETGVSYFKWDAIGQYGCDAAGHDHGSAANSPEERAECYAFQQPQAMTKIVDRVCSVCPEAIVDFDVTEGGRCFGLGFLSAGKYFLINNGPYFGNYDMPYDWATATTWSNIFVNPGPSRGWICRTPLTYDRWIPSVLFLTHYLPDDPAESQLLNIASLILGQNGIWGDLLKVSDDGVRRFGRLLSLYKLAKQDITESFPVCSGQVGGAFEVHQKLTDRSGRGAVVAFATAAGTYTTLTTVPVSPKFWSSGETTVTRDKAGHARIEMYFEKPGAKILFFGVDGCERRI